MTGATAYNGPGFSQSGSRVVIRGGIDDDNVVRSDAEVVFPGSRTENCHLHVRVL